MQSHALTLRLTMSVVSPLAKPPKKPKRPLSTSAQTGTRVYGVELAATDFKALRLDKLPTGANVMIVSVGDYPKVKLPKAKTKGLWQMRLVKAKGREKTG